MTELNISSPFHCRSRRRRHWQWGLYSYIYCDIVWIHLGQLTSRYPSHNSVVLCWQILHPLSTIVKYYIEHTSKHGYTYILVCGRFKSTLKCRDTLYLICRHALLFIGDRDCWAYITEFSHITYLVSTILNHGLVLFQRLNCRADCASRRFSYFKLVFSS